jgi:hypothetical protein
VYWTPPSWRNRPGQLRGFCSAYQCSSVHSQAGDCGCPVHPLQEGWLHCAPVLALQQNLGLERQAAFSFCYTWFDEVRGHKPYILTPDTCTPETIAVNPRHVVADLQMCLGVVSEGSREVCCCALLLHAGLPACQRTVSQDAAADGLRVPWLQTLSPMQEAWLEANSYPWCPDIWCAPLCYEVQHLGGLVCSKWIQCI